MSRLPSLLPVAVCAGLLAFSTATAAAQQCGLRNSFRLANSHSGVGSEVNVYTGWQWQAAGPLVTPGFNSHTVGGCTSSASCTVSSDYGTLRCVGAGSATNCASSGVFLWLDQAPQANFMDTLTVVSSSLPNGAPVQLQVAIVLDGYATVIDTAPMVDYRAEFAIGSIQPVVANGPGTAIATIATTVGAQMMVRGSLSVALHPQGILNLGIPPQSASIACDLTARTSVECATPGASLQWCSGSSYVPLFASATPVGGGCGAGSPVLSASVPVLGQTQNWSLTGGAANQPVLFVVSFGPPTNAPYGPCAVRVDLGNAISQFAAVTNGVGSAAFGLAVPVAPGFAGVQFTAQSLVFAPSGPLLGQAQLSNAVSVRLGV